jgi:sugar/nucleoside kinase (ribokinase family)
VLAAALAEGANEEGAFRHASVAAGLACRRSGAQVAQPTRAEVDTVLAG